MIKFPDWFVTCHYCQRFHDVPLRLRRLEIVSKDTKVSKRFCKELAEGQRSMKKEERAELWRVNTSPACSSFIPAKYFYCRKDACRIHILTCISRMKNPNNFKSLSCPCSQGFDEVMDIVRGRDLEGELGVEKPKTKLVIRRQQIG